jgi:D-inositol-3-phosphate glycosyltransferase
MRYALVSEHASPLALVGGVDAGGQNVHVGALAEALAGLGHEVVVHTRRDDPHLPRRVRLAPGVEVDHVDAGPAAPVAKDDLLEHMGAFSDDLLAKWRDAPPDVVHSHFWMSGIAALPAARRLQIPILHTFHALGTVKRRHQGDADTSPPDRIRLERHVAMAVDRVVATTEEERRELVQWGTPPDRIRVVPCGVDLGRFRPDGPAWRRDGERSRVVVVSRLVDRKGIGNAIEAVSRLDGVELVVAGGAPAGLLAADSSTRRYLALARTLGVEDRVTFLGAVPREEVPALLRSADVVLCCPWYEPFGLVAVEAMACGIPVVASAVGGLAETVVDGVTGALVPARDPDAIADGIRRALGSPWWGTGGWRRSRRYGWNAVAAETDDVALEVLSVKGGVRS